MTNTSTAPVAPKIPAHLTPQTSSLAASLRQALNLLCAQDGAFYAHIANSLEIVYSREVHTFAVGPRGNRYVLYVNPSATAMPMEELKASMEHEICHIVLHHLPRWFRILGGLGVDTSTSTKIEDGVKKLQADAGSKNVEFVRDKKNRVSDHDFHHLIQTERGLFLLMLFRNTTADYAANEFCRRNHPGMDDPAEPLGYWALAERGPIPQERDRNFEHYLISTIREADAQLQNPKKLYALAIRVLRKTLQEQEKAKEAALAALAAQDEELKEAYLQHKAFLDAATAGAGEGGSVP